MNSNPTESFNQPKQDIGTGRPLPLGATVTPEGVNFAIFAGHVSAVTLVLFDLGQPQPSTEIILDPHTNRTGGIWHIAISGLKPPAEYGYRVDGNPNLFHPYHPDILLLDPYARAISGGDKWGGVSESKIGFLRVSRRRSCVIDQSFDWKNDRPPRVPIDQTIIYELHVRGFTRTLPDAGTFRGIANQIPYFQKLGITTVELLPIHDFDENDNDHSNPLTGDKLKNFWGYNSISFFVPKPAYAGASSEHGYLSEFKEMVRDLHRANIEVVLDVVFNHTAEGNEHGPYLHFRGIDNCVYYMLGRHGEYMNFSGCGNTVNCNHPVVSDLIIDCLRYWVIDMHIDGFRFDLATIMTRDANSAILSRPPLIERIARDPILQNVKLIAEPWDAGGGYQVGSFPHYGRWSEWNGKFRDDVRSFLKGDNGKVSAFASRILASPDFYGKRSPSHSINFVTSHDGFTLNDLVSYNRKRNKINGEDNRDGTNDNHSWNCGVEGATEDKAILVLRRRQMKNFLVVLFCSQGVPMLVAGDEFARTQQGNNNAYCQDNEISWVDWTLVQSNNDLLRFTRELIFLRRHNPALRQRTFVVPGQGFTWHGVNLGRPDWSFDSHSLAFNMDAAMVPGQDNDIYLAINAYWHPLKFELPQRPRRHGWRIIIDTGQNSPWDIMSYDRARRWHKSSYRLAQRSIVMLMAPGIIT